MTTSKYPHYNPALGRIKLDGDKEVTVCNQNVNLDALSRARLIAQTRRRFHAIERSTLVFAANLRRLHDAGIHKRARTKDFTIWASEAFEGLSRPNAKLLCWQGVVLLVLDGHGLIDIDAAKPRLGVTAARKLSSLLSHFDEDTVLTVYRQMDKNKPTGKLVEADVVVAMQDSGVFILNRQQQEEEEHPEEIVVKLNSHDDQEDFSDTPANEEADADDPDIEAILHLHQELVDPFDKLRRSLVKLTDPDNQPYDIAKIREQFNEAVDLLMDLERFLDTDDEDEQAA
jgi:hypothetical protein